MQTCQMELAEAIAVLSALSMAPLLFRNLRCSSESKLGSNSSPYSNPPSLVDSLRPDHRRHKCHLRTCYAAEFVEACWNMRDWQPSKCACNISRSSGTHGSRNYGGCILLNSISTFKPDSDCWNALIHHLISSSQWFSRSARGTYLKMDVDTEGKEVGTWIANREC